MADIGDNGGPPLEKWTAAKKIERIKQILDTGLSAAQKCIGVGIVAHADTDGIAAEMSTVLLQTIASVKDRETVYRATERLEREHVAAKIRIDGRPNNYRIIPARVMQQIEDAFNAHTGRVQPDGVVGSNPTGISTDTGRVQPDRVVGLRPTSPVEPDRASHAHMHARLESPSGINIPLDNNKLPPTPQSSKPAPAVGETGGEEELVQVNCVTIKGPNFTIDLKAIDQIAMLTGMPSERARAIAEIHAREWAANNSKPNHPMAWLKKAIAADKNDAAIAEVRLGKATASNTGRPDAPPDTANDRVERMKRRAAEQLAKMGNTR